MLNALLEIGCEEIPARFIPGFLDDLKKKAEDKLKAERITFDKVETFGTYRRLTLYIENIATRQDDLSFEAKGPPANIAFDKEGKPTPAAIGFAKKQGLTLDDLKVENNYVVARVLKKGLPTNKVLQKLFPEIISSLYQPLAMRWGSEDFKFIRPIHWIVGLLGSSVVRFEIAGVRSADKTQGHRYHSVGTALVAVRFGGQGQALSLQKYKQQLKKLGVIVDQEERKALIHKQVEAAAQKAKCRALVEADLLDEVTYLVENPLAYVGRLDDSFLEIPQEVLITSMKKNQKYFPLLNSDGRLQPRFVVVTDGCKNPKVALGNEKVLTARLTDAKFFFEEDKKQTLLERVKDLKKVSFFEKLGTMADKVERIGKLAEWISRRLKFSDGQISRAKRIALLSKADLTTKMVYEFPTLQGEMGKQYALLAGEDAAVAEGIFEHYLPRFAEDELPKSIEAAVVGIADRLDSLVGCFSIGAVPTGSVDPYALRRTALGLIKIVAEKQIDLLLDEAIEYAYKLYDPILVKVERIPLAQTSNNLIEFIAGRLKPLILEQGIRYDVADAVLAGFNDILDVCKKSKLINAHLKEKWFSGVVASADRVGRIAAKVPRAEVFEADLVDPEEKALHELYLKVNWEVGEAANREKWEDALLALAKLTAPIEAFFDKVMVMHKDERLKLNRLALLGALNTLYCQVADFPKIVIK